MKHPQTYFVNLNAVGLLQSRKDAPDVNSFNIDLDLARYLDLDLYLNLVRLIKTPEAATTDSFT